MSSRIADDYSDMFDVVGKLIFCDLISSQISYVLIELHSTKLDMTRTCKYQGSIFCCLINLRRLVIFKDEVAKATRCYKF